MRAAFRLPFALALSLGAGALLPLTACGDDDAPTAPSPTPEADAAPVDANVPLCVDGKKTLDYPPGPYLIELGETLPPDLVFDGPTGPVSIASAYEPCASPGRILVVRSSAAWCGPCVWQATHTKRLFDDPRLAGRLLLLDLLIADEDNMPPTVPKLDAWRAKIDAPPELAPRVAIDPAYRFKTALLSRSQLPAYVFVDTRTMKVLSTERDPSPRVIQWKLAYELATMDGSAKPTIGDADFYDGRFSENQVDLVRGMKLVATPPPDPTNAYADDPAAAALGKTLFSDVGLSPSGVVSCASCHAATKDLSDGLPQSIGVGKVNRNSPGIGLAAHSRWQFWDGRADTLWMQALGPPEDVKELGSSRLFVAHRVATTYATEYGAVFGATYPLDVVGIGALPPNGKPGDAAYDALSAADKEKVTRVYVNVGKAIAAFERTFRMTPNALDAYADGDVTALTDPQKRGLFTFFETGCIMCHWGPRLTDDAFHVLRFETGRADGKGDLGRFEILPTLADAEFVATSKWSDDPSAAKLLALPQANAMFGAFKTPTLRGLPKTAPYGHGGTLPTLLDVAKHYGIRGLEHGSTRAAGTTEEWVPLFDTNAQAALPPFLEVLGGDVVVP